MLDENELSNLGPPWEGLSVVRIVLETEDDVSPVVAINCTPLDCNVLKGKATAIG